MLALFRTVIAIIEIKNLKGVVFFLSYPTLSLASTFGVLFLYNLYCRNNYYIINKVSKALFIYLFFKWKKPHTLLWHGFSGSEVQA